MVHMSIVCCFSRARSEKDQTAASRISAWHDEIPIRFDCSGLGRLLGLACVTGKMRLMMTRVMIFLHSIMMVAVTLCGMVAMI